jgi:hypothetical protein
LGFGFVPTYQKGSKNQYQLVVAEKAWKKLKERLKIISLKTTPVKIEERIAKIKELQRGWLNYFRETSNMGKLRDLYHLILDYFKNTDGIRRLVQNLAERYHEHKKTIKKK